MHLSEVPYRLETADPPWWSDAGGTGKGGQKGAQHHYPLLKFDEIVDVMREWHNPNTDGCLVAIWETILARKENGVDRLFEALGVRDTGVELIWHKGQPARAKDVAKDPSLRGTARNHIAMGQYSRANHEYLRLGVVGKIVVPPHFRPPTCTTIPSRGLRCRRGGIDTHSNKPEWFYSRLEEMVRFRTPRLEMFARRPRDGWYTVGKVDGCDMVHAPVEANRG